MPPAKNNDRLTKSPLHMLHRAGQCAEVLFGSATAAYKLTPRQFAVLLTIVGDEGLNQTAIVERTGIDRSTMADMVKRLSKKGLLQRRRTRVDARAYAIKLTDEGKRLVKAVEPLANRVDDKLLKTLSAARSTAFLRSLETIIDRLNEMREDQIAHEAHGLPKQQANGRR